MKTNDAKDKSVLLIPSLLLLQSLFVGSTFKTTAITFTFYVLAVFIATILRRKINTTESFRWSGSIHRTSVTVVIFLFFVGTASWRLTHHLTDTINLLSCVVDSVAHIALIFGLVLHVFYPRFGHPTLLGLGLLVVMLCVAAGGSSQSLAGQVTVALFSVVGFLFSSRFILNHWSRGDRFEAAIRPDKLRMTTTVDRGRTNLLFSALALSIILMTTSAIAHVTGLVLPDIQGLVYSKLQTSLDAVARDTTIASSNYVRGDRIGSIRRHMSTDPAEITLKVYSKIRPGYLKGSAFEFYHQSRWNAIENDDLPLGQQVASFEPRWLEPVGRGTTRIEGRSSRRLNRFQVSPSKSNRFATVEVHNEPLKGNVFFVPMNIKWIECAGRHIRFSNSQVLEHGPDRTNPYVLGIDNEPIVDPLDNARRHFLMNVPPSVSKQAARVAKEVCGSRGSARGKAAALQNYFQNEYEYSLRGTPMSNGVDPIARFLELKHPAHCEFFASASVLILRSAGVPARYVTGYVADEFDTKDDVWVARHRDAHAWVEAYDDQTKTWFPVESTPGRSYLSPLSDDDDELSSSENGLDDESDNEGNEGFFSKTLGWIMSMRATDPLSLLFRVAQWPLFLSLVYLMWRRFLRDDHSELNPEDVKSKLMLAKVDRLLRKHQLIRSPSETMHQFATRLENHSQRIQSDQEQSTGQDSLQDKLQSYADWYRQFAESRYQGQLPDPLV